MTEKESALYSHYIIDGVRMDMTPAELLDECMEYEESDFLAGEGFDDIIDESTEPPLSSSSYDASCETEYLRLTADASNDERHFMMLYPEYFTRLQIAKALLGRLWSEGHFRLGNLRIWAQWEWNCRPLGNMAAFYSSAASASEYIYGLGVKLEDYLFIEGDQTSNAKFFAWLEDFEHDSQDPESLFKASPYESRHAWIEESRRCPAVISPDPSSWIIYIPFDTCSFKIGGSLLSMLTGNNGGKAPSISDPDYFIDCYEVVRELVEDGIIMAGVTVADGGMATAAYRMCGEAGMKIDIKGIMASYQETDRTRILFGEVPGVLIQISDENYDYVDSQFILQDIAYYPIGHPTADTASLNISETSRSGVSDILASLMKHTSEGED